MTISPANPRIEYDGDGEAGAFAVPWRFDDVGHLAVTLVAPTHDGLAVLGADYTVSGAGLPGGGLVNFVAAPAHGVRIVIERATPAAQLTAYPEGGPFPSAASERALDRLTMIAQEHGARLHRRLALTDRGTWSADQRRLVGLAAGEAPGDAVTVSQLLAYVAAGAEDAGAAIVDLLENYYLLKAARGAPGGVAALDGGGTVPLDQLPVIPAGQVGLSEPLLPDAETVAAAMAALALADLSQASQIDGLAEAQLYGGVAVYFMTRAALLADLGHPADVIAAVTADPVTANNGLYRKSGASGAGAWTQIYALPDTFAQLATYADAQVAIERSRAETAEAALLDGIIAEVDRASAAEAALADDLAAEAARAEAAEAALAAGKADKSQSVLGAGLAVGSGTLGSAPTITVPAADGAAAAAGTASDSALTPASAGPAIREQTIDLIQTPAARAPGLGAIRPLVMDESGRADLWLTDDGIDGRFARPSALRVPVTGGVQPLVADDTGRAEMWLGPDGIDGRFARPSACRTPLVSGWRALEMDEGGLVTRGTHDGVPYDPAAIGQPVGEAVAGLGYDQVMMTVLDARTLAPEIRQVTLSQTGDVTPLGALGPTLLKARGPDPRYPVGAAQMVRRNAGAAEPHYLRIVITHGQSNALGGRDETLTPNPALPDNVLMWNGGIRAYVPGASHTWEYIADPAMYASLVPAKFSGAVDQPRDYEGHDLGAGEAVALAYGLRDKVLVQNHGIAGRSVPYLVGDTVSYAPAWQNLRNMVIAAVSQAASMGLIPIIEGLIWNSGEAHDNDTRAYWLEQVELIRSRTDELMSLTGQTRRIPIVFVQVAATKNETGDSRYHEPCMATEEWVRDKSRFATIIPSMWSEQDDVAQVHHKARFYRHAGEMAGKIMVQMHDAGRHDHVMITAASRRGRVVTVEFSEPVTADTYGVSDPGSLGVSYCQGTTYITVRSVEIAGRVMRLTLASVPSGIDERVYLGARGAKRYAEYDRWGIGAFYGNRHCIRGLNPESWSHSTCRPLWRWAPQQRFAVTVEDAATSFWAAGIWGGPGGNATWSFLSWGGV